MPLQKIIIREGGGEMSSRWKILFKSLKISLFAIFVHYYFNYYSSSSSLSSSFSPRNDGRSSAL